MFREHTSRPFGEDDEEEHSVDDVNEALLGWFGSPDLALRALARSTPLLYGAGAPAYRESDQLAWHALAWVLGRADDTAYKCAPRLPPSR
jgi:hypothetical protein